MKIVVKPFSRSNAAIRLAYGKVENGKFVPINDVRNAPDFSTFASRQVSGKFGAPSYTDEYDLQPENQAFALAVQKWEGISSPSPTKVWEVIYGA